MLQWYGLLRGTTLFNPESLDPPGPVISTYGPNCVWDGGAGRGVQGHMV